MESSCFLPLFLARREKQSLFFCEKKQTKTNSQIFLNQKFKRGIQERNSREEFKVLRFCLSIERLFLSFDCASSLESLIRDAATRFSVEEREETEF